ncbi:hypothetical protein [Actinoplanes sp. NPDC051851]|uniref:hypothetical protein n=1 Tax=Actinoplanes sp. NPDC051851 TaxID=3154753 RepID=UPI00344410AF
MRSTNLIGIAVGTGAFLAACATGLEPSSATTPSSQGSPSSPSPIPTISLTEKPPREPTDNLPDTGWVAGMVTRGGSGPCYGLTADDGTRYALYSATGTELAKGDRVKVKLETTRLKIYCGPGSLMAMTASEPIG